MKARHLLVLVVFLSPPCIAAPGDIDTAFGTGGKVTTAIGTGDDFARAVAVQADGKIIVAGTRGGTGADFALVRYNPDGSPDTTLNGMGKITTDFGGGDDHCYAIAIQDDGRMVLAGSAQIAGNYDIALARYNPDGTLDTTFNGTGKVTTAIGTASETGRATVIQSDGKIVVAGSAMIDSYPRFALVRYNPDGSLDSTLNGTGKVTTTIRGTNTGDSGTSAVIQPDGKIVVGGTSDNGANVDFALVRYNQDGSLDSAFGDSGKVTTAILSDHDYGEAVALQPDGKILFAGWSQFFTVAYFAMARYRPDGSLDADFNGTGKVVTALVENEYAQGVAVQGNGKIVVGGYFHNGANTDFALARYSANGTLDATFNGTGMVTTAIGNGDDCGYAMALQDDGKILVSGTSHNGTDKDFALARYLGDIPATEISVECPTGTALVDGTSVVGFGPVLTAATKSRGFTVGNVGWTDLTGLGITFDGEDSADFSITSEPTAPVAGPMGSTTFTVRFAPSTPGEKTAALHIESNDADENPFDIALAGRGLDPEEDDDSDGMTNSAEVDIATAGIALDPLVDNSPIRSALHDSALGIGLYRASDIHALALGAPVLEPDPATGKFHLTIGVLKSPDLTSWSSLTGYFPTYDPVTGKIDIEITPGGAAPQFFKVLGAKP